MNRVFGNRSYIINYNNERPRIKYKKMNEFLESGVI